MLKAELAPRTRFHSINLKSKYRTEIFYKIKTMIRLVKSFAIFQYVLVGRGGHFRADPCTIDSLVEEVILGQIHGQLTRR